MESSLSSQIEKRRASLIDFYVMKNLKVEECILNDEA